MLAYVWRRTRDAETSASVIMGIWNSVRRADRDPPLWILKMAGYAFGSNPPCEFSSRSGNRQDIVSMMEAA
jgi:hypothetical protein